MKGIFAAFFVACLIVVAQASAAQYPVNFYVSPDGNDANPGTLEQPFRTLERARDAVRSLKNAGQFVSPVEIMIRGGTYPLAQPFVLRPEDSGTPDKPITYKSYPGEKAIISGGETLALDWQLYQNGIYMADVSQFVGQHGHFNSLFVNDKRAVRARTPNEGVYFNAKSADVPVISIQAESGTASGYEIKTEDQITYAVVPEGTPDYATFNENAPKMTFSFNVAEAGYYAFAINAFHDGQKNGAYYVKIDDGEPVKCSVLAKGDGARWLWQICAPFVAGSVSDPAISYYTAGAHALKIYHGSERAKINTFQVTQKYNAFRFNGNDIDASWPNLNDIEVVALLSWSVARSRISSVASDKVTLLSTPFVNTLSYDTEQQQPRYYVENMLSGLDSPGEWYLKKGTKKLFYQPRDSENIGQAEFIVPVLKDLMIIEGTKNDKVRYIGMAGLTFAHADWNMTDNPSSFNQSGIMIRYADNLFFIGNTLKSVGGNGIDIGYLSNGIVAENEIYDMGESGVICKNPENVTIANNTVHDVGIVIADGSGIFVTHAVKNSTITGNEVFSCPYIGIRLTAVSSASAITYNHVYDAMQKLEDGGAIYTYGITEDVSAVTIANNVVHDVMATAHHAGIKTTRPTGLIIRGIYMDDMSRNCAVRDNLLYNVQEAIQTYAGVGNVMENNIFVDANRSQTTVVVGTGAQPTFYRNNIIYYNNRYPELFYVTTRPGGVFSPAVFQSDNNLYFSTTSSYSILNGSNKITYEKWKSTGLDANSVIANPLFIDYTNGNFRLQPNSPAYGLGFKEFDVKFGIHFKTYGGRSCDDIADERCINGGSNLTDRAYCGHDDDCVYSDACFAKGTYADLTDDGRIDGWCMAKTDYKSNWRDCDNYTTSCIGGCMANWTAGGESAQFGEYDTGSETECCGDDAGEHFITTGGVSSCCDEAGDTVLADGSCKSSADLNDDGKVDISDLAIVAYNFGMKSGFDEKADTDDSGEIDIFDVVFVSSRFT
ncbi:MAG: right-handed parallel beta-helix repeat-containing protein [Candidatus Aenigmatarchaeota archaeon]